MMNEIKLENTDKTSQTKKKEPFYLIFLFIVLTLGIGLVGYSFYQNQKTNVEEKIESELKDISILKTNQIVTWRNDVISDGEALSQNPFLIKAINDYFEEHSTTEIRKKLLNFFTDIKQKFNYKNIYLLDKNNSQKFSLYENRGSWNILDSIDFRYAELLQNVMLSNFDLTDSLSKNVTINLYIPLIDRKENESKYLGMLIMEIDPSITLFPMVQSIPMQSKTYESVLIQKMGDYALLINELRDRKNNTAKLKIPLSEKNLIAVQAIDGVRGLTEGQDYRGEEVISNIQIIPGSEWYLINKIDKSEIKEIFNEQSDLILVLLSVLILTAAASIGLFWRHKNVVYYQNQFKIEHEKKAISDRYKYILKYANDIFFLLDRKFIIVEANKRAVEEYGYSLDEFKKLKICDVQSEIGKILFEQNLGNINNKNGIIFESEHIRNDRTLFSVEISARPVEINGEIYYLYIIRNINDRKKMDQKLKENETRYRELIEQASDGILISDEKGKIVFVNPKTCRMLGYNEAELIQLNVADTYIDNEKHLSFKRRKELVNGYDVNFERNIKCKNGKIFPVEISLKRLQNKNFQGIIRDISERKKADEELKRTRKEFKQLFENSPLGIYRTTPDGRILMANKALIEMLGYNTFEEFSHRNLEKDTSHQRYDRKEFKDILEKNGEIKGMENEWIKRDGSRMHIRENAKAFRDEKGQVIYYEGTLEDITEKKIMEQIVRDKEETSRALLNAISETVLLCDTSGKILTINETACKRLGGTENDFLGANLYNIFSGPLLKQRSETALRVVKTGEPQKMEDERDGKFYDLTFYPGFDIGGKVNKVAIFGKDITEQKLTEQKVKVLYSAVQQSPASVVITDMSGDIEYVNPKFTEVTGYEPYEVIGKNPRVLKTGKTTSEEYRILWNTITSGKVWQGEFLNKKKNGDTYWESAFISPIKNSHGETVHYLAVKEDITDKKTKDEQIQKSLKEKDLMLKEIYHRVKNNLQIIISLLKLQEGYIKDSKDIELFKVSQTRIKTMALIHEQLYRSGDLTRIYFEDYVTKLSHHLSQAYDNRNVVLNVRAKGIYLDIENAIPCGLIVNEIISNSLKHAFPNFRKGKIDIEMSSPSTGSYRLSIKDDGIGFPDDLDFRETKSLGMQLVVTLTEQLDGTVTMKRENGTEFLIEFSPIVYEKRI